MIRTITLIIIGILLSLNTRSASLLIPMDNAQKNHLKAYGIAFWSLQRAVEVKWLLNYRGGSFMLPQIQEIENECLIRGVNYEVIADGQANLIVEEISSPSVNMDVILMQKAPKIAVYSPPNKQPWDDAVTLVLTYAEIPYDIIYDEEILDGKLSEYDWLHLHHEDFTGQFGKFFRNYQHMPWYQEEVRTNQQLAQKLGFLKVSEMKLVVSKTIKNYVLNGGFLFAMCAATDTYDIALSAENTDVCESMYDGDPAAANFNEHLDFTRCFAFQNFTVEKDPYEYEFSNIDVDARTRKISMQSDYFTLFDFSAKWDPVPTMLCQNHTKIVKGFLGQTTAYHKEFLKPEVLVMGENKAANEARYIHGEMGNGTWTFYGGHDPEDYSHEVGSPPTELKLYPNSPGYRLILNNVLFPAAKKKKQKT
ncbi:MAG TPA: hypothetical protein PLQ09_10130 [Prolixibacteraceae bacterium]|nr:asparagine synthetase B [Bacteroidales bacterium]HQN94467.1 hypothetical protein [Prolixibacteraceae bacterium]